MPDVPDTSECLHNHLNRSSVDGDYWFWKCDKCGKKFDIIEMQLGITLPNA